MVENLVKTTFRKVKVNAVFHVLGVDGLMWIKTSRNRAQRCKPYGVLMGQTDAYRTSNGTVWTDKSNIKSWWKFW